MPAGLDLHPAIWRPVGQLSPAELGPGDLAVGLGLDPPGGGDRRDQDDAAPALGHGAERLRLRRPGVAVGDLDAEHARRCRLSRTSYGDSACSTALAASSVTIREASSKTWPAPHSCSQRRTNSRASGTLLDVGLEPRGSSALVGGAADVVEQADEVVELGALEDVAGGVLLELGPVLVVGPGEDHDLGARAPPRAAG